MQNGNCDVPFVHREIPYGPFLLLFDMIAAAEEQGIDIPTYRMVAEKFKESNH